MRIHKYISQCGVCSRREAERKILEGAVEVNGALAQIGQDVDPDKDRILVDGVLLRSQTPEKVVLAMNKPKGLLCTNSDPFGGRTVFDILPEPFDKMKLFCCGRLDKSSQGLLILTNDGDLANRISHPSSGIVKRYHVVLNRDIDPKIVPVLLRGVVNEGEKLRASKIILDDGDAPECRKRAEVWLNQGRKREIRRMFETMGFFVKELKRFQIGGFKLRRIPEGEVKILGKKEISLIFQGSDAAMRGESA